MELAICPRCSRSLTSDMLMAPPYQHGPNVIAQTACWGCGAAQRVTMSLREWKRRAEESAPEPLSATEQGRLVAHFRRTLMEVDSIVDIVEWVESEAPKERLAHV